MQEHPIKSATAIGARLAYRPDIDGLRAIAVAGVVGFHAAPLLVPGGFVGVDVFFVISGYLITGLVLPDVVSNTFSFRTFYERRLRRIAPALFAMTALASVVAAILYVPKDFQLFVGSLLASQFFVANHFFLSHSGYFSAPAEVSPLLHLWSLSVEEQFYLVFPPLLLAVHRFSLPWSATIGGAALISFGVSALLVVRAPDAAFFVAPSRGWELLLGSLLATTPRRPSQRLAQLLPLLGLVLVLASFALISQSSTFPAWGALPPCIGAALIVLSEPEGVANGLLSWPPLVGLGLVSYSLYLWHWPVLAFGRYVAFGRLTPVQTAALVVFSLAISILSYRFVERPFRRRGEGAFRLRPLLAATLGLSVFVAGIGLWDGAPWRLPRAAAALVSKENTNVGIAPGQCDLGDAAARLPGLAGYESATPGFVCRLGNRAAPPTVVLWGDSHAHAEAPALDVALSRLGIGGYLVSHGGCGPFVGLDRVDKPNFHCRTFSSSALGGILALHPMIVILAGRWAPYFEGSLYRNASSPAPRLNNDGPNFPVALAALHRSVSDLANAGIKVILVRSVPEIGVDVPSALARAVLLNRVVDIAPTRADFETRQARSNGVLNALASEFDLKILDPGPLLCSDAVCPVVRENTLIYGDEDHLTTQGAMFLEPMFEAALAH